LQPYKAPVLFTPILCSSKQGLFYQKVTYSILKQLVFYVNQVWACFFYSGKPYAGHTAGKSSNITKVSRKVLNQLVPLFILICLVLPCPTSYTLWLEFGHFRIMND